MAVHGALPMANSPSAFALASRADDCEPRRVATRLNA